MKHEYLCKITELNQKDVTAIYSDLFGKKILIIQRNGELYAWLDACPHYANGPAMALKKDQYMCPDQQFLMCFGHGAKFEIATGLCVQGPCLGKTLTAIHLEIISDEIFCIRKQ